MATFGQGINPALGRIDYSGYQQGAMAGAQGIGQGIAALGQAAGQAIKSYYDKKESTDLFNSATDRLASIFAENPAFAKQQLGLKEPNDKKAIGSALLALAGGDKKKAGALGMQIGQEMVQQQTENQAIRAATSSVVKPSNAVSQYLASGGRDALAFSKFQTDQAQAQANIGKTLAETSKLGAPPPPPDLSFQEQNLQAKVAAFVQANGRQPNAQEQAAMYSEIAGAAAPRMVMTPQETLKLEEGKLELAGANTALTGLQTAANAANDALSKNAEVRSLLNSKSTNTGFAQQYVTGLKSLLVRSGLFPESAQADQEKMEALVNEDALRQTQDFLQKQGAVTEAERKRVEKTALDINKVKGANIEILNLRDAAAQRLVDASRFVEEQREGGKSLTEANKALNKWYRENTLKSYFDKQGSDGETKTETIEGIGTFVQDANGNWVRK